MAGGTARRERKVVTVVFCDLVGFTSRAESLDPEDVEAILGVPRTRAGGLERHGGTVEKFIGDAVEAPDAARGRPERAVAQRSRSGSSRSRTSSSYASGSPPARRSCHSMRARPRARAWPPATSSTPLLDCKWSPGKRDSRRRHHLPATRHAVDYDEPQTIEAKESRRRSPSGVHSRRARDPEWTSRTRPRAAGRPRA